MYFIVIFCFLVNLGTPKRVNIYLTFDKYRNPVILSISEGCSLSLIYHFDNHFCNFFLYLRNCDRNPEDTAKYATENAEKNGRTLCNVCTLYSEETNIKLIFNTPYYSKESTISLLFTTLYIVKQH